MSDYTCRICGGALPFTTEPVVKCEYCGNLLPFTTADSEKKMTLFARANRLRRECEFDRAAAVYESIAAEFPEESEASWGIVLCRYGIEYVDDPATGKKVPTCHRSSYASVLDDPDYQQTMDCADPLARKLYHREAAHIEELREGILSVSASEEPYDIFICYKETDDRKNRTLDSVLAQDIYDLLTDKGYRVFFSRISLEDKLGREYEPYIFAALNSAKVMLAVGTCFEHYDAVWVKNEWSRFLKLMEKDREKHLIPCYKDIDAYDMPREFRRLQSQDLGKLGAHQDLLRGLEKLVKPQAAPPPAPAPVIIQAPAPAVNHDSAITMGFLDYEMGKADTAIATFRQVLLQDNSCPEAYLGLALATKGDDRKAYLDKYIALCGNHVSELEKKIITRKNQDAILEMLIDARHRTRLLELLPIIPDTPSPILFIKAIRVFWDKNIVQAFVDRGCDINCKIARQFKSGTVPIPLLSYMMVDRAHPTALKIALECGADPNGVRKTTDGSEYCPLGDAIWNNKSADYVRLLLEHGADVTAACRTNHSDGTSLYETLLDMAISYQLPDIVDLLLEHGADPNLESRKYRDQKLLNAYLSIFAAVRKKQWDLVERLLKNKANPQSMDLSEGDEQWPLLSCLLWNEAPLQIVQLALECGADPNVPRTHPNGPYMPLDDSLWNNENADYARLLITYGANIHHVSKYQFEDSYEELSILNRAVCKNNETIVSLLLERGVNADSRRLYRKDGKDYFYTALSDSISEAQNLEITKLLLKHGADPNKSSVCPEGEYLPLFDCFSAGVSDEFIEVLIAHGADIHSVQKIQYQDYYEEITLLNEAVYQNRENLVASLLAHGADANAQRLYRANGMDQILSALSDSVCEIANITIAKMLLEHGADANFRRVYYDSPATVSRSVLSDAICTVKNRNLAELLLRYGANPSDVTEKTYSSGRVEKASLLHEAIVHAQSAPIFYLLVKSGASINTPTTNVTTGEDIPFCKYPYNLGDDWKYLIREAGWKGPGLFSRFF